MKTAKRLEEERINKEASGLLLSFMAVLGMKMDEVYDCAIVASEKIINALPQSSFGLYYESKIEYWNKVKEELQTQKNKK